MQWFPGHAHLPDPRLERQPGICHHAEGGRWQGCHHRPPGKDPLWATWLAKHIWWDIPLPPPVSANVFWYVVVNNKSLTLHLNWCFFMWRPQPKLCYGDDHYRTLLLTLFHTVHLLVCFSVALLSYPTTSIATATNTPRREERGQGSSTTKKTSRAVLRGCQAYIAEMEFPSLRILIIPLVWMNSCCK